MFETGVVRANACVFHSTRSGGIIGNIFRFSLFDMKVFCVFSLEMPNRGDSNEYTHYTIFNKKRSSP